MAKAKEAILANCQFLHVECSAQSRFELSQSIFEVTCETIKNILGGYLPYKTIPFYLIGATWCIASFVLINAYNCTLMSHLTLPHKKPLIDSIYDLRDQPNLHLVTDQNLNVNSVLSVINVSTFIHALSTAVYISWT